jgi:hypothetical protein
VRKTLLQVRAAMVNGNQRKRLRARLSLILNCQMPKTL